MSRSEASALAALSAIWGSSYLFIAIGGESLPPITLVAVRVLIGAAALQLALRLRRVPLPRSRRTLAALAFMGVANNIIPFVLITWSETPGPHQVSSGLAAVLTAAVPIFTVLIANFALADERFTPARAAGVAIGFAGVGVLMSPRLGAGSGPQAVLGALAVVVAALSYAVAAVFARRVLRGVAPLALGAVQMTWSTAALIPLAALIERPNLAQAPFAAWFAVAWLGLLGSGVAYILYFGLIQSVGATRTALVTYLAPVVAVILGAVFNGEAVGWTLLAGMGLIVGGAAMVNRRGAAPIAAARPASGAR